MGRFLPFPSRFARPDFACGKPVAAASIPAYIEVMDTLSETRGISSFDEILADFELLDDWEDRYRYVIELGRRLEPLPEAERIPANKVQGCVSQVWLADHVDQSGGSPRLDFHRRQRCPYRPRPDRDPVCPLLGQDRRGHHRRSTPARSSSLLHLKEHLTPQRSNGLMAMVKRIRRDAETALSQRTLH